MACLLPYRTLSKAHEFMHLAGDYAAALGLGEHLIASADQKGHLPNIAMAKNDPALTLKALRCCDEAEMLTQALDILRKTLPPDHPRIAEAERRLAALPAPED